jgi:tetratricopeptide (TPR) repeat protein
MKNCIKRSLVSRQWSLVTILFSLTAALNLFADATQDGAAAFAKGDFSGAARAYETAIASSGPSAGLYYNLATAQLKNGQRPQAALSLRRAILLDPRLIDARIALSDIERSQGVPRPKSDWRGFVAEKAPLQILVLAGCVVAWLGAFLLLFAIFQSGRKFVPFLASLFLLAFGAFVFLAGTLADPRIDESQSAVVLAEDGATLLAAPADQSATVTKLPAGASLRILQRSGEWAFCQSPAGQKGWTLSKSLESVVPAA